MSVAGVVVVIPAAAVVDMIKENAVAAATHCWLTLMMSLQLCRLLRIC